MNRYISITLLTLFLYSSIGHFLLLGGTLCAWKHEVKDSIMNTTKEDDLLKISLSENIRLLEDGKEIEYCGKRYDIVKKDAIHYFCFQDEKETHLIKKMLSSLLQKANDSDNDFSIFKDFFKLYFIEKQQFIHFFYKKIKVLIFEYPSFFSHSNYDFFIPPIVLK